MMVFSRVRRAKCIRPAHIGMSGFALAAMALPVTIATPVAAKTPGKTYCYYGTCHRVKTIEETRALVGVDTMINASHYDDCRRDRYNPCGLTSSGERFHPDRPDNTASPIYPDGTTLLVWNPDNERALVVRVNNAGPYWGDRKLDLSRAAAEKLGFEGKGVAKLKVRVVKAPEPAETVYVRNRNYPPVPGDIGTYTSFAQAETGMVVAMALQASAASPLAPVTTANAFGRSDDTDGLLVAEAPQVLGRSHMQVAAVQPMPDAVRAFGGLKLWNSHQSRRQVASLGWDRDLKQTPWDEDVTDEIATDTKDPSEVEIVASVETEVEARDVATEEPKLVSGPKRAKRAREQAAKLEDESDEPVARAKRPRKSQAKSNRGKPSRTARANRRNADRARVAYAQPYVRIERPSHTAGQLMSLGIRAQSSSTM
jgi:rare lipoprotein A (peptidoglycan hydrolase)